MVYYTNNFSASQHIRTNPSIADMLKLGDNILVTIVMNSG